MVLSLIAAGVIWFSAPRNGTQSEARRVINTLLPPATLTEICQRLILHYLPLTSDDLQNWNDDPEEFSKPNFLFGLFFNIMVETLSFNDCGYSTDNLSRVTYTVFVLISGHPLISAHAHFLPVKTILLFRLIVISC